MKKIAIILLALLIFAMGCTEVKDDGTVMLEFTKLKQEYKVKEAFSPNLTVMNDYINDLSELRGESSMFVSKVLDAEIASAQSFYYLINAYESSQKIDFFPTKCSLQEIRNSKNYLETLRYIKLSIKRSNDATDLLASLNAAELEHLRGGQLLMVKQYAAQSKTLENELLAICS